VDERISFQWNRLILITRQRKTEPSINAIRSVNDYDIEEVEAIISEKKELLKNSKDVDETDRLFAELEALE
jgi:hypothetical protein